MVFNNNLDLLEVCDYEKSNNAVKLTSNVPAFEMKSELANNVSVRTESSTPGGKAKHEKKESDLSEGTEFEPMVLNPRHLKNLKRKRIRCTTSSEHETEGTETEYTSGMKKAKKRSEEDTEEESYRMNTNKKGPHSSRINENFSDSEDNRSFAANEEDIYGRLMQVSDDDFLLMVKQ